MRKDISRQETKRAILKGIIKVPDMCRDCGANVKLDCHHMDYNNPLDVIFLCPLCHEKRHLKGGMSLITVQRATCGRCGHEWQPRVENPVACPRCKNPNWND